MSIAKRINHPQIGKDSTKAMNKIDAISNLEKMKGLRYFDRLAPPPSQGGGANMTKIQTSMMKPTEKIQSTKCTEVRQKPS